MRFFSSFHALFLEGTMRNAGFCAAINQQTGAGELSLGYFGTIAANETAALWGLGWINDQPDVIGLIRLWMKGAVR